MFETIVVRRQHVLGPHQMDLGFMAETLLFYGRVRLVVDRGMLTQLAQLCGPELLVEAITSGRFEITYHADSLGVRTDNVGTPSEVHWPVTYKIGDWSEMQDALPQIFQEVTGKSGRGRRLANRVASHLHQMSFSPDVLASAQADYLDGRYMERAVGEILRQLAPTYAIPQELRFEVVPLGEMVRVESNVDFAAATWAHQQKFGPGVDLSPSYVLSAVLNAGGDLHTAGLYSTELATDPLSRVLIEGKCRALMSGRARREEEIRLFEDVVLQGGTIAEVVNSGERTFADVLRLLDKADRFREWLQRQDPTERVVDAYYRDVTAETWIASLPAKLLRWSIVVGVAATFEAVGQGVGGVALSAALGAADTFLLERLVGGWRPNQFVDGKLRSFVRPAGKC